MRFRQHQEQAQAQTVRLFIWFAILLVALALSVNLLLALVYKLIMPLSIGYPALFFETNTAVVVLFVLGGAWVETQRLREGGGPRIAHWMGGREIIDPDDGLERRLINVVDEMAIASGQPVPRVFVLPREDAINAFVAGWDATDIVMCVTRGALDRLTRAEL
ncbi:MAG: peptidase M48, partial [Burkholderiales bacterium]|nr:peptidase M48 [Burkholderiales bacterium]